MNNSEKDESTVNNPNPKNNNIDNDKKTDKNNNQNNDQSLSSESSFNSKYSTDNIYKIDTHIISKQTNYKQNYDIQESPIVKHFISWRLETKKRFYKQGKILLFKKTINGSSLYWVGNGHMYRLGEKIIQALKARINIAQGEALGNELQES